ncbi:hypothetical protein K4K49_003428 [Colletotrichum sp. SAR 10_70]|nr:hypothetical protein K4K50_003457 [Colletotrichum sp. SAR 10_71]KAI8192330.1 hypothetical protein K4K51_003884 [Colletotrichum sp. SAR 10_75]KAI8199075.1 hypothetical protein K4K49_003428 [Colletotrichum sp. SAR 10_70]KAI8254450.1 hypothetical protein K4K53_009139 [Colletotrichum sp. SAR 10_77]KAJ5007346.1 hypothetical protein K4K48_000196 [Colletotrichum sp. SAR 10_66]
MVSQHAQRDEQTRVCPGNSAASDYDGQESIGLTSNAPPKVPSTKHVIKDRAPTSRELWELDREAYFDDNGPAILGRRELFGFGSNLPPGDATIKITPPETLIDV